LNNLTNGRGLTLLCAKFIQNFSILMLNGARLTATPVYILVSLLRHRNTTYPETPEGPLPVSSLLSSSQIFDIVDCFQVRFATIPFNSCAIGFFKHRICLVSSAFLLPRLPYLRGPLHPISTNPPGQSNVISRICAMRRGRNASPSPSPFLLSFHHFNGFPTPNGWNKLQILISTNDT
jgi:hypothetical protein